MEDTAESEVARGFLMIESGNCFDHNEAVIEEETGPVILINSQGCAFLSIAPPMTASPKCRSRNLMSDAATETGSVDENNKMRVILMASLPAVTPNDGKVKDDTSIGSHGDESFNIDDDNAVLIEAIESRRVELEKETEIKAELVYKRWCQENKSLQQAIDESLKNHLEMHEIAHALRLRFEHEKAQWTRKLREDTLDEVRKHYTSSGSGASTSASARGVQCVGESEGVRN